ncbi:nucleoside deaminase [Kibdelosporangium persicum]|uniref:tRNA-specific adenosine deaminase n=2 Tax=Kibdelosporangium persicum TaxID=2698649 RepID=A0ABX2FHR7_9PSEU|nr:tRNA-specific adenosine deaminase [Kibdelosporangium persicum]
MTMHASRELIEAKQMLAVARQEALRGKAAGGIPIGAALYGPDGELLGSGHNRRVQDDDPSMHAETAAFRNAGRRPHYRDTIMVTTLSPCWYCSGLVRQFNISRVVIGEATTFSGGHDWLAEHGVQVTIVDDPDCVELMTEFIKEHPDLWFEDIGEERT